MRLRHQGEAGRGRHGHRRRWPSSALSAGALSRARARPAHESQARGELLASAILHRRAKVVVGEPDPYAALARRPRAALDPRGERFYRNMTYAAIVDPRGMAMAHSDPQQVGQLLPDRRRAGGAARPRVPRAAASDLLADGPDARVRQPLFLDSADDEQAFGSIRIGISTLLIRQEVNAGDAAGARHAVARASSLEPRGAPAGAAAAAADPCHPQSLTRLGEGEFGVTLDAAATTSSASWATSFERGEPALSAAGRARGRARRARVGRRRARGRRGALRPVGQLVYASGDVRRMLPRDAVGRSLEDLLVEGHPYRMLVEARLHGVPPPRAPSVVRVPRPGQDTDASVEQAVRVEAVGAPGRDGGPRRAAGDARSSSASARSARTSAPRARVATFGRLAAGLAHEMKNRLNATVIQLELFRSEAAEPPDDRRSAGARASVDRRSDPAARRGGAGLPEVHPARGAESRAGRRSRRSSRP